MNEISKKPQIPISSKKRPVSFWLAIIFGLMLFVSVVINFLLLATLFVTAGITTLVKQEVKYDKEKKFIEVFVRGEKKSPNKILLVPIKGVILEHKERHEFFPYENMINRIASSFEEATKDKNIKGIILELDSPGGGITSTDLIWHEIQKLKKTRPNITIVALMKDVAASGAYYIAASCDYIIAHETTITGSIGVISFLINVEELMEKIGVKVDTIKVREKKDLGSPFRPMTPEERKIFEGIIQEMYERFVSIVADGRKKLTKEQVLTLADGRIFTGKQALKNGLVDALGYMEDAVEYIKKVSKLPNVKVIKYKRRYGLLWDMFFSVFNKDSSLIKLKDIVPFLEQGEPKFMYLWIGK